MKKVIQTLNKLVSEGIIGKYAIGGSIGAMFYTETFSTKDVDVFVLPQMMQSGVVHLGAIYDYLRKSGLKMEGQYFIIGGVPVDFVAVYNDLTLEALENTVELSYGKIKVKVLRPEYLSAIALQTGRSQDLKKAGLLSAEAGLDKELLKDILKRHGLSKKWREYIGR